MISRLLRALPALLLFVSIAACGGSKHVISPVPIPAATAGKKIVTADQAAFPSLEAAIHATCDGSTPGQVILSPGTTLVSHSLRVPSNCTIEGRSADSTVKLADGVDNGYVFENADSGSGNQNIVLKNFTIDGNKAGQNPTKLQRTGCIRFKAVTSFHLLDMDCVHAFHHGIEVLDGSGHGWITGNRIRNNQHGTGIMIGTATLSAGIKDIHITHNTIGPIGGANCIFTIGAVGPRYGVSDVTVSNNSCHHPEDVGIEIGVGTSGALVEGNDVSTSASGSCGIMVRGAETVNVSGNAISGSASSQEDGIFVWGNTPVDATRARNIRLEDNSLEKQGRAGIYIAASQIGDVDGVYVKSNATTDAGDSALTVSDNARNVTIAPEDN